MEYLGREIRCPMCKSIKVDRTCSMSHPSFFNCSSISSPKLNKLNEDELTGWYCYNCGHWWKDEGGKDDKGRMG
jgi:hypothetical protein